MHAYPLEGGQRPSACIISRSHFKEIQSCFKSHLSSVKIPLQNNEFFLEFHLWNSLFHIHLWIWIYWNLWIYELYEFYALLEFMNLMSLWILLIYEFIEFEYYEFYEYEYPYNMNMNIKNFTNYDSYFICMNISFTKFIHMKYEY